MTASLVLEHPTALPQQSFELGKLKTFGLRALASNFSRFVIRNYIQLQQIWQASRGENRQEWLQEPFWVAFSKTPGVGGQRFLPVIQRQQPV